MIQATPYKNVSLGICRQWRPWSACTYAQPDQGLHCPIGYYRIYGEEMPTWYSENVQNDLNVHILSGLEGTFFAWHGQNVSLNFWIEKWRILFQEK